MNYSQHTKLFILIHYYSLTNKKNYFIKKYSNFKFLRGPAQHFLSH